ncbi:hypothetical protein [Acetobacter malorum]|uniref:hypothetical protein n=1 Tax=Acetobacter malorum TaxID=178901 RepID=UPI00248EF11C|nr:hypothetical protein [Acetobacter malorum]
MKKIAGNAAPCASGTSSFLVADGNSKSVNSPELKVPSVIPQARAGDLCFDFTQSYLTLFPKPACWSWHLRLTERDTGNGLLEKGSGGRLYVLV